jgi:hypothetical protein
MAMETTHDNPKYLLSIRKELLINNDKFPALARYSSDEDKLVVAYISWLKEERIGKHVCYLDLTFELPSKKEPVTLSIISGQMDPNVYASIMKTFINGGNTLYSHSVFKEGIPCASKRGEETINESEQKQISNRDSEQFFLHEIETESGTFSDVEHSKITFSAMPIPIKNYLKDAENNNPEYYAEIDSTKIEKHWEKWVSLHLEEKNYDLIKSNVGGYLKWILVIPLGILSYNGDYKNVGSIFLGMDCHCNREEVINFTRSLIILLLSSSQRYYEKIALNNSIKTAIAAIMARNMSHNLGSHVFYYTRNEINKLSEDVDSKHKSDLKGLSWFLHYVQERQDFVATVTSQDDYYLGPLNLKMDVLDEITPDAVDKRHNSEPPATNFILKFIVNSEGLTRLQKYGDITESTNFLDEIELKLLKEGEIPEFNSWDNSDIAKAYYDIDLAVKGGQQSRHAFLIILENIIRNAAKHAYRRGNSKGLRITIKITKIDSTYKIDIFDNCDNAKIAKPKILELLNNIEILNTDNDQINKDSKGLKEIIVCIAWLKNIKLTEVFKETKGIYKDILDIGDYEGNLCYSFTLPIFMPITQLEEEDIAEIDNFNKHGQVYVCNSVDLYSHAIKFFPRAVIIDPNKLYWKKFAYYKLPQDTNLPFIVFEREGVSSFANNERFIFVSNEDQLADLEKSRPYIIFKNHLTKSGEYLKQYFDKQISQEDNSRPLFIDNLSGATYAFNLFQKAQAMGDEEQNTEIYYKIIESFYTRIAIIDERLCPINFSDSDLSILVNNPNLLDDFIDKIKLRNTRTHLVEIRKILSNQEDIINKVKLLKEYWSKIPSRDLPELKDGKDFKYLREFYSRQNTYLYNMNTLGELLDPDNLSRVELDKLAPHFFSVHIGLLDKLDKNISGISTKEKLQFLKISLKIPDTTYIAVHSGRGGLTDQNKDVTFIPFANLQWSLENCKFKLSELFYNQIYFPI